MWDVVFNISDSKWIFDSLRFSIPWLAFACVWTFFARKAIIVMPIIGGFFIIIGLFVNIFSVYYYFYDKSQLASGEGVIVIEGLVKDINDNPKNIRFTIGDEIFSGSDYMQWIVPNSEMIEKIKKHNKLKVYYVPKAEHGVSPPGNKVLRIDVFVI